MIKLLLALIVVLLYSDFVIKYDSKTQEKNFKNYKFNKIKI